MTADSQPLGFTATPRRDQTLCVQLVVFNLPLHHPKWEEFASSGDGSTSQEIVLSAPQISDFPSLALTPSFFFPPSVAFEKPWCRFACTGEFLLWHLLQNVVSSDSFVVLIVVPSVSPSSQSSQAPVPFLLTQLSLFSRFGGFLRALAELHS